MARFYFFSIVLGFNIIKSYYSEAFHANSSTARAAVVAALVTLL